MGLCTPQNSVLIGNRIWDLDIGFSYESIKRYELFLKSPFGLCIIPGGLKMSFGFSVVPSSNSGIITIT